MRRIRTSAINIGVNKAPGLTPLRNAENDARALAAFLAGEKGPVGRGDVFLIRGRHATKRVLGRVLRALRADPPDVLFVSFSGHGSEDAIYLADGSLGHTDFARAINRIGASRVAVVIDACHAAAFASQYGYAEIGALPDDTWQEELAAMLPGVRLLLAARPHEFASDGTGRLGVFTAALLNAMRTHPGDLPAQNPRFVSAEAAFERAVRAVYRQTRGEQYPRAFGPIADFPIARASPVPQPVGRLPLRNPSLRANTYDLNDLLSALVGSYAIALEGNALAFEERYSHSGGIATRRPVFKKQ